MAFGIETGDLSKDYGPVRALDGLTVQVEEGEVFGFLGPNGAGKSTTIRLLLDLIRPTSGWARIRGHDCQADSIAARREVGYLAGEVILYDRLTGSGMVDLVSGLRERSRDEPTVRELAGRLELDLTRRVGTYSKGNRQKLGIVLALMHRPPVLLLDEPTSGLDPFNQRAAHELFREAADGGTTVFFSSHIMSEVEQLCDRVGIIRRGNLVAVSTLDDLRGHGTRHVKVRFRDELPPTNLHLVDGIHELKRHGSEVEYSVPGDIDPLVKALSPFRIVDIDSEQPTLEEILFTYYETEPVA